MLLFCAVDVAVDAVIIAHSAHKVWKTVGTQMGPKILVFLFQFLLQTVRSNRPLKPCAQTVPPSHAPERPPKSCTQTVRPNRPPKPSPRPFPKPLQGSEESSFQWGRISVPISVPNSFRYLLRSLFRSSPRFQNQIEKIEHICRARSISVHTL